MRFIQILCVYYLYLSTSKSESLERLTAWVKTTAACGGLKPTFVTWLYYTKCMAVLHQNASFVNILSCMRLSCTLILRYNDSNK
jgi:rhamnogalacturonyl hydrolase YesR